MTVELIMIQGSRAGTAAPIHPGYYLVGRHKECQIRPKSRSVSRRHCLLLRNEDGFGALDLKSTSGTFVNGERVEPHTWRVLVDGDEIRFGKVGFTVSIKQPAFAGGDESSAGSVAPVMDSADMETPLSWQNFDVAEFLADEDQTEMEERYGKIRLRDQQAPRTEDGKRDDDGIDPSVFSDDEVGVVKSGDTIVGDLPDDADVAAESDRVLEVDSAPKKRPPRRSLDPKEYKRGSKRTLSFPAFSISRPAGGLDWKLVAVVALALATIGLLGYQVYRFQGGTDIQIRENLD